MTPGSKSRILAVDDDHEVLDFYSRTLENAGYEVIGVLDGTRMLSTIGATGWPNLVLLDLNMPGMDGQKCLDLLGRLLGIRDIPVIACSARSAQKEITRMLLGGVRDYLVKPFGAQDLLETVARHLGPASRPAKSG